MPFAHQKIWTSPRGNDNFYILYYLNDPCTCGIFVKSLRHDRREQVFGAVAGDLATSLLVDPGVRLLISIKHKISLILIFLVYFDTC